MMQTEVNGLAESVYLTVFLKEMQPVRAIFFAGAKTGYTACMTRKWSQQR